MNFTPTWIDRTLKRLSNNRQVGNIIDLGLYWSVSQNRMEDLDRWLWRGEDRLNTSHFLEFAPTLVRHALTKLDQDRIEGRRQIVDRLLGVCPVLSDIRQRAVWFAELSSEKEWSLLFKMARTQGVSNDEGTLMFALFSRQLKTPQDHARAYDWVKEFCPDPTHEANIDYASKSPNKPESEVKASVFEYALLNGNETLLDFVLENLVNNHQKIASQKFSKVASRALPLSARNVMLMERLGVEWSEVLSDYEQGATPQERTIILSRLVPSLPTLIPQARDMKRAERQGAQLEKNTAEPAAKALTTPIAIARPRRI